jgi:hypothetical protein
LTALAIAVKLLAQVPWRSAHTWVVAAALIRGVALAPLASFPTARMGAPVVAPVVVVALAVSAISFAFLLCFFHTTRATVA